MKKKKREKVGSASERKRNDGEDHSRIDTVPEATWPCRVEESRPWVS